MAGPDDTERRASTPARIAAALALIGGVVLLFLVLSGGDSYQVTARFQNAGQLVKGNLVQNAGTKVGTVQEIVLNINEDFAPLRVGTRATIRQASLSGVANRYIDLEMPPGEVNEEIEDGGVIPKQHTVTSVDLDHLFSLFDEKTRKGLKNVVRGFGATYAGKSKEAEEGWQYLNPSLVGAQRLFEELSEDEQALESFVVSNAKL